MFLGDLLSPPTTTTVPYPSTILSLSTHHPSAYPPSLLTTTTIIKYRTLITIITTFNAELLGFLELLGLVGAGSGCVVSGISGAVDERILHPWPWPQTSSPSLPSPLQVVYPSRLVLQDVFSLHLPLPASHGIFKTFLKIFLLSCWVGLGVVLVSFAGC